MRVSANFNAVVGVASGTARPVRMRVGGLVFGMEPAEAIELANQLAVDGDPHKKQIAEALKNAVTGGAVKLAHTQAAQTGDGAGEGRPAVPADPFSSSGASKSLEQSGSNSNGPTAEPPKPKRGRPPKNRLNG